MGANLDGPFAQNRVRLGALGDRFGEQALRGVKTTFFFPNVKM